MHVFLHFFDLSNANSLQQLQSYLQDLPSPYTPCASILVGCKRDLQRQVTRQQVQQFIMQNREWCWDYWEVSNVTLENVNAMFKYFQHNLIRAQQRFAKVPKKTSDSETSTRKNCHVM